MSMYDSILTALRTQMPSTTSETELSALAHELTQRAESQIEVQQVPASVVQRLIQPTIQIMLAHDHSSIVEAAQYAIQVLVTQLIEDPSSTIPVPLRSDDLCPYPGLAAFAEVDAPLFRGREDDITAVLESLDRPLLAITGPSGVGKSSLMYAGLVPALRQHWDEAPTIVIFRISTSGSVLSEWALLLSSLIDLPADAIALQFQQSNDALRQLLVGYVTHTNRRTVLVLDQFEELFVGDDRATERQRFLDNLLGFTNHGDSRVTIILATRENFFEHPDYVARPDLATVIQRQNIALAALTDHQLRIAIEYPLVSFNRHQTTSLRFQEGLIDIIVTAFRRSAVALPLVQYMLRLLWIEKGHLTHSAYNSLGGLDLVLDRHATKVYTAFSEDEQPLIQRILLALVRPGLDGEYTRKRVKIVDLLSLNEEIRQEQRLQRMLHRLTSPESRIVSEVQTNEGSTVELTHEILLRQWGLMGQLIEINKERLKEREHLLVQGEQWSRTYHLKPPLGDTALLYRGSELRRAGRYVLDERYADDIDGRIERCYRTSLSWRNRVYLRIIISLCILLAGLGLIFWTLNLQASQAQIRADINATAEAIALQKAQVSEQNRLKAENQTKAEQRRVESRRIASLSSSQIGYDRERALLLAYEAFALDNSLETEQALRDALDQVHFPSVLLKLKDNPIQEAQFSPKGDLILTRSENNNIHLWNTSGMIVTTFDFDSEGVSSINFSPDGQKVVISESNGFVRVWDIQGGLISVLDVHNDSTAVFAWDNDHIFISTDDTAIIWDVQRNISINLGDQKNILSSIISPNGYYIVTSHKNGGGKIWNIDGQVEGVFNSQKEVFVSEFSPDSLLFITQYGRNPLDSGMTNKITVWSISGDMISEIDTFTDAAFNLDFTTDSKNILISPYHENMARLWSITGQIKMSFEQSDSFRGTAMSPDGKYIFTGSWIGRGHLWDMYGNNIGEFIGPENIISYRTIFTKDSSKIITAFNDNTITVWDIEGSKVATFKNDTSGIVDIYVSNNEEMMLSLYIDGTIRIWPLKAAIEKFCCHYGDINHIEFIYPGDKLIIAYNDGYIGVWNLQGQILSLFYVEEFSRVQGIIDGQYIVSVDQGSVIKIWDTTGVLLGTLKLDGDKIQFSRDGRYFVVTRKDDEVQVWENTGDMELYIEPGYPVWDTLFDDANNNLIYSTMYATISDMNANVVAEFKEHGCCNVYVQAVSPNGKYIVSIGDDRTMRLWDNQGQQIAFLAGHVGVIYKAKFSPDGQYILSIGEDNTARLWDINGQHLKVLRHHGMAIVDTAFTPNGMYIALAGRDGTISFHPLINDDLIKEVQCYTHRTLLPEEQIQFKIISPTFEIHPEACNSRSIFLKNPAGLLTEQYTSITTFSTEFSFPSLITETQQGQLHAGTLLAHTNAINDLDFSADGRILASASNDLTIRLWDVATKQEINALQGHTGPVESIAFSPDGRMLASGAGDGSARLWDVKNGTSLETITEGSIQSLAFSPDNSFLALGLTDGTIVNWHIQDNIVINRISAHSGSVRGIAFSPDGEMIASAGFDGVVLLWNSNTGGLIRTFETLGDQASSVSFSYDGSLLASATENGIFRIWRVSDGVLLDLARVHDDAIENIAFSSNADVLAVGYRFEGLVLWDTQTKTTIDVEGQWRSSLAVSFSPKETIVATAGYYGAIWIWKLME